jgi:enoyl-CoA hydratase
MAKWITSSECVSLETDGPIATVTLNRPEKRNALSPQLLRELREAMKEADDLKAINVIILQGAGQDFSAGYDLGASYGQRQQEKEDIAAGRPHKYRTNMGSIEDGSWNLENNHQQMRMIFNLHKPVIAKIQGNCVTGGTDLALMCDILIAAEDARIGYPACRSQGSPPHHMWFYHVGPQWAKRILFTGDSLTGADAARIGLVLDAVPADRLDAEVDALARRIALVDSDVLACHKRIVNLAMELSGADTIQRLAAEMDARANFSTGPGRARWKQTMADDGLRVARGLRDGDFGDDFIKLNIWRQGRL